MEFCGEFTKEIYENHVEWLMSGGVAGSRANLNNADLRRANLNNADLRHADLSRANLRHADLSRANLRHANLSRANLRHADLSRANLNNANLNNANLNNANLNNADLRHADLNNANLFNADLRHADLRHANLFNADLFNADLFNAIGIMYASLGRDTLLYTYTDQIHIGCITMTIDDWLKSFERVGRDNNYTTAQIEMYGGVIKLIAKARADECVAVAEVRDLI